MPALPLTQEQLDDAARLKQCFQAWQRHRRDAQLPSSQEAASDLLGVNQSALSQYLNGRIPLNLEFLLAICGVMGVSPGDISPRLAKKVEIPASTMSREDLLKAGFMPIMVVDDDDPRMTVIPKVRLRLTAGISGFQVESELHDDSTSIVPTKWVKERGFNKANLIAIEVRGESMEPTFYAGDTVVLNVSDKEPTDGGVFAINYEGEPVVKRMMRDAGQWWLTSDNPDARRYPRKLCQGEGCIVIGRVVRRETERF